MLWVEAFQNIYPKHTRGNKNVIHSEHASGLYRYATVSYIICMYVKQLGSKEWTNWDNFKFLFSSPPQRQSQRKNYR